MHLFVSGDLGLSAGQALSLQVGCSFLSVHLLHTMDSIGNVLLKIFQSKFMTTGLQFSLLSHSFYFGPYLGGLVVILTQFLI